MSDDDAPVNGTGRNAAAEPADASAERAVPFPRSFGSAVSGHVRWAKRAKRDSSGKFKRIHEPKPKPVRDPVKAQRSRVTNNTKKLFLTGPAGSAAARRFSDIMRSIISDLGGVEALSEGQKQLARRAASLSLACERLEEAVFTGTTSAAEQAFMTATDGLSPYAVLRDAGKALHGVGRVLGGNSIRDMAALPPQELDRVVNLLTRAGDLASKAIAAGSAQSADLELLGLLSDRLGRTFARLGMARQPREVNALAYSPTRQQEVWSPLRDALKQDARPVGDADALEPIDVPSEAAE